MNIKNAENIKTTIIHTVNEHCITLQEGDVQAFCKAYIKFGDIDLALNSEGDVLSDVMEAEQLDIIAGALDKKFGSQSHSYPHQIYTIKINNRAYRTYVDDLGDQRFLGNKILNKCLNPQLNYEEHKAEYENGTYCVEEWIEFNAIIGSKLKDTLLTLKTSVEVDNPRDL